MKPFMGIDITTNKKNETPNGSEFLIAEPSSVLAQSLERSTEEVQDTLEKASLNRPLQYIKPLCGLLSAVFAVAIIKGLGGSEEITISQSFKNNSWLFWTCGAFLLAWGLLELFSIKKLKSTMEKEESEQSFSKFDSISNAIYSELSVPFDAKEVDVLSFYYKNKDGKIKVCEKFMQMSNYFNFVFKAFADSENLYLANLDKKYAFPLSSITSFRTVKKTVRIPEWNKEENFNKGIYKQYKLVADNAGCIHCKYYHILEINHNGETFGIYIPCYELPIFEELTGLKAQEQ